MNKLHNHKLSSQAVFPVVLVSMAWLLSIGSLYLETLYGQDLFSRSGSLMVLLAMIAEYKLLAVRDSYHNKKLRLLSEGKTINFDHIHPDKSHYYLETIVHVTVIVGTVIWGYSDLL